MTDIETIYLINRTHTDICFTDHQDVVFRQHNEFIDGALDLIEATQDLPSEARYRWTCEASGPLLRWLRQASPAQRERLRSWNEAGYIDVTGLPYPHMTQAHTNEQLVRAMFPVRAFREDFGLSVTTAMQSDVTGAAWRFADLLPAAGMDFFTMSINVHRALAPEPRPGAFWWEGPSGGRILTWNGLFYLWGRSIARLGDWRFAESFLPRALDRVREGGYQWNWLATDSTHPTRVDNGPADPRMPEFVKRWNDEGRTPRLANVTMTQLGTIVRERHGDDLPTFRGDWTDWWTNGYGADARMVGVSRQTHDILESSETMQAWLTAQGRSTYDAGRDAYVWDKSILSDELVWGAHSSNAAPEHIFSKSQYIYKVNDVYMAAMESHDLLARAAHGLADGFSERDVEGVFNLGDLAPEEAYPTNAEHVLVFNTLPWDRRVIVEEPELRGNAAPVGMLESFFPRGVPWGGERPERPILRVEGVIPALGYAFIPLESHPDDSDLTVAPNQIENAYYRVKIDPATGALAEWFDKELGHDFAGRYQGWGVGQYVYEWIDDPRGRDAQFLLDFSHPQSGHRYTDTPYVRETATTVAVGEPTIVNGRASIVVTITGRGIKTSTCTYALDVRTRTLEVDWSFDKEAILDPESVYVAFPFNLDGAQFALDQGGSAMIPETDQIEGASRDWYYAQRWAAVSDGERTVVVSPLDSGLMQVGGLTIQRWARELEIDGPTVMAWPMNNHWDVNFKASQDGIIPERYRLTTHEGGIDSARASRFGAEQFVFPVVVRDRIPVGAQSASLARLEGDSENVLLHAKPAEDGRGIVLRVENVSSVDASVVVAFESLTPTSACLVTPVEADREELNVVGRGVPLSLAPRELISVRVVF